MNWTIIPADEWRRKVRDTLMQNASALIEIDRKIIKAIVESSFENLSTLISEFRDRKINVRKGLAELGVVEDLDDSEKEVLVRVQKGFATDSVIEQFERSAGQGASFYELSDKEVDELGQDLFYTWISHYE